MKLKKLLVALFCVLLTLPCLFACSEKLVTVNENSVIIKADSSVMEITDSTKLKDYMDALVTKGELTYKAEGTFINTINELTASSAKQEFWALYTDDESNANKDWGTIIYEEKTYNSATLGFAELPIKDGYTYIWTITTW